MAVWQIESGACTGRGFAALDVDGICAKFYTYITAIPAAGGPGWTILIDKSATPVIQNFPLTDVSVAGNEITLAAHGYLTGETVIFSNTGGGLPGNISAGTTYYIIKTGVNTFKIANTLANAYNVSPIDISSQGTGTHHITIDGPYIIVSNVAVPAVNEICFVVKIGYLTLEAGYIRVQHYLGFDDANNIPMGVWNGNRLDSVDAGAFAYDFRGGDLGLIIQARIGTSWKTSGIDTWTGSTNFVEGTGISTDLTAQAVAGSVVNIEVTDSSSFSVNKYYYIWDCSVSPIVNYVKCTAKPDPTHITVDLLSSTFPIGSIISAYSHRHYAFGDGANSIINFNHLPYAHLPYFSGAAGYVFNGQSTTLSGLVKLSNETVALTTNRPNDEGFFSVQRGFLTEFYAPNYGTNSISTGMNRAYGITSNTYLTGNNSLSAGNDGRTIGGINYLFFRNAPDFGSDGSLALLFLDKESLV